MKPRTAARAPVFLLATLLAACSGELRFADLPPDGGDAAVHDGDGVDGDGDGGTEGGGAQTVSCGTAGFCMLPSTICCANGSNDTCTANSFEAGPCPGLLIACDDTLDCSGTQVCCIEFENDDGGGLIDNNKIGCKSPAECGTSGVILCELGGTPCPGALTCQPATVPGLPPGYHQCR